MVSRKHITTPSPAHPLLCEDYVTPATRSDPDTHSCESYGCRLYLYPRTLCVSCVARLCEPETDACIHDM
eukprot:2679191-Pyramimonas_sp.AAC.1